MYEHSYVRLIIYISVSKVSHLVLVELIYMARPMVSMNAGTLMKPSFL